MSRRGQGRPTCVCAACGKVMVSGHYVPASLIRPGVAAIIAHDHPAWSVDSCVCLQCLNRYRTEFVRDQMEKERGELTALEREVVEAIHQNETVVENLNHEFDSNMTMGERVADKVAEFGGSWRFIILFFCAIALWVIVNCVYWLWHPFDPYPFILLNLMLSLLASIQAPIIMMSQNRAAARDRLSASNDFKVNLKAELEVRAIGDRLDQLLHNQWVRLLEIQQIQMEMLEDLAGKEAH